MKIKSIMGSCVILSLLALSACGQKGPLEQTDATKAKIATERAAELKEANAANKEALSEETNEQ